MIHPLHLGDSDTPHSPAASPATSDPSGQAPGNASAGSPSQASLPQESGSQVRPPIGLPVADLVGLRFSVVHLRLAGYALLGVWLNEIIGLLAAPLIQAVGTRLHYISQALDLSPLLLVGLALVAFQGGLQRSWLERLLLPLLFALLPLLSAIHFLMAPASIANALTLSSKQDQVGKSELRSIEGQLDRAAQVLSSSQDLKDLQRRLDAIPGVRVESSADISLEQARRDVQKSLDNERRRVKAKIGLTTAQVREQFTRRAIANASMATLIGVMLAWCRAAAMREMNLSSTYLAWVLLSDPDTGKSSGLKDLLAFQKRCLASSYLGLFERIVQFSSSSRSREEGEIEREQEQELLERLSVQPPELLQQPPAPWEPAPAPIRSEEWRRRAGMFSGMGSQQPLSEQTAQDEELEEAFMPSAVERRRQQRDRERVRIALTQFAQMVSYEHIEPAERETGSAFPWRRKGPSERQLRKAREALESFALQFAQDLELEQGHHARADNDDMSAPQRQDPDSQVETPHLQPHLRPPARPIGRLVDWLIKHL